jgi:alpha-glucoside transport system substrate-binding protein
MGALVNLGDALDVAAYKAATAPAFVELGTVDDELAGVFVKGTVKGLIWYNPRVFTLEPPTTWDQLKRSGKVSARSSTRTWCMGLEAGEASGWPATDWIEDILLRQSGPKTYDDWLAGRLKWNSPAVHQAFATFGEVIDPGATAGGAATAIATNFADAGTPLFADQAGCLFLHQASFIPPFFKRRAGAREGEFNFFPFPAMNPRFSDSLIVAGDLFGMFHDTPESRALMNYLVSDEAQAIRVQTGGALSVNSHVTVYPDEISRREAALLQNAQDVRFDASDLMPDAMNKAFLQASIDFARDPSRLDDLLNDLDQVAAGNTRPRK